MSTAGHTPGPWEVVDRTCVRGPFAMGDHERQGLHIASIPLYLPECEGRANARLIAAAPELLEVLQGLLSAVSVRIDDPRIAHFDKAHAVVAKATGAPA